MVVDGKAYFELAASIESQRAAVDGGYECPCCGALSFSEAGGYEICPCGWEDDPVQEAQPDLRGGANKPSLIEARENFSKHGVSDPELARRIEIAQRKPKLP
jgi:hypothetical protein